MSKEKVCKGPAYGKNCKTILPPDSKKMFCDECRRIRQRASRRTCIKKNPEKYYDKKTGGPKSEFFTEHEPMKHNIISNKEQFQIDKDYKTKYEKPRENITLDPKNAEIIKNSPYTKSIAWLVS
jgi:hypothetical protein